MPYKINGTSSKSCLVYVIDTVTSGIDTTTPISAGSYEINQLSSTQVHVVAVPDDSDFNAVSYRDIDTTYYT